MRLLCLSRSLIKMIFDWLIWVVIGVTILFSVVVLRGAPYLPSHKRDLKRAFTELYPIGAEDVLVDIGSGDGVVLRLAASHEAKAIGYEINPILVLVSSLLSIKSPSIQTKWRDFWQTSLPAEVTVVYVFGESRDIKKMAEYVKNESVRLQKSIWLISYAFEVPGMKYERAIGAHFLYKFKALHSR